MIRRYSRPRTLIPGCTSPRRARVRLACGLTTIPSPPLAVSSSHQATPAAVESGSVVSTIRRRVAMISPGAASASRSASGGGVTQDPPRRGSPQPVRECEVPAVVTVVVRGVLGGKDLERGEPDAVQAVGGPAVPPVGGSERVRVGRPGLYPVEQCPHVRTPVQGLLQDRRRGGQGGPRGRADGSVLVPQQSLGLGGPGQQFAVEQQPVGVQFVP